VSETLSSYPKIILKKGKERSVSNFHPWIFSGAIDKKDKTLVDGDIVNVFADDNTFLGCGFFHHSSIAVRIVSYAQTSIDQDFWNKKIATAFALRRQLNLTDNASTTAYRLVHGEGDGLSGLIVDIYNSTAVMQAHVEGIFRCRGQIALALQTVFGNKLDCVYDKSDESFFKANESRFLIGERSDTEVTENDLKFYINWVDGQKTGFFNDQRDNRKLLQQYSNSKKIVNLFSYSGGFSVYALAAGASFVHSVDSSAKAETWANKNIALNNFSHHQFYCEDVFEFLKASKEDYDVWVVDPPAFAKRLDAVAKAMIGYRNLNMAVFKKAKPGSIIFTFSCSQAVDKELFSKVIFQAAQQARRSIKILHRLSQPADHPVSVFHPEGEYLKGLVLYVEE
jgi:23S rRNA (cytosine1962-C5)-methyltransferase